MCVCPMPGTLPACLHHVAPPGRHAFGAPCSPLLPPAQVRAVPLRGSSAEEEEPRALTRQAHREMDCSPPPPGKTCRGGGGAAGFNPPATRRDGLLTPTTQEDLPLPHRPEDHRQHAAGLAAPHLAGMCLACPAPPPSSGAESDVSDCEQQSFINSDSSDDEFYEFNEN
ncbi:Protein N-terminal asparagine amidohydrolase [Varanus komodoensis]|nr:Protein N-terminal asparagine amidohydrolase [Varanus komodoensis]